MFNNDIPYGTESIEVSLLQKWLIDTHYATFTQTSGYFGSKTKQSVANLQAHAGIYPNSGIFGPRTRAYINSMEKPTNASILCAKAISMLGRDATPLDTVSDEVACAETVNAVFKAAFGMEIGGGASTALMREVLVSDPRFKKIDVPEAGCIIISATGLGTNPAMPHGHVGIILDSNRIGSNNSSNGNFDVHYSVDSWTARYKTLGGYPVEFFRVQ